MRRHRSVALAVVGLAALLSACTPAVAPITRDGAVAGAGNYRLHLDDNDKAARPLVVVLGGLGQSTTDVETMTGADRLVDSGTRVTVAYAVSPTRSWNAGSACCDPDRAAATDDVTTIDHLLAAIETRMGSRVDRTRVYVWGFSNGSSMAARYGCARSAIAAIGMVDAPLLVPCGIPVAMLHYQAIDDAIVPYHGGYGCACYGPALGPWPDSVAEGSLLPAGSIWRLSTFVGGHTWPANATDQLWAFTSGWHR